MLRSIRNVKLLKCVSLICLSPLFVFYSSLINLCFCWVYTCNGKSQSGNAILVTRYLAAPNLNFKGLLAKEHANLPQNAANDSVSSKEGKSSPLPA